MGSGFTAACPECGYKQNVQLGSGMYLPDIWAVVARLSALHRRKAEATLRAHPESVFSWHRALFKCATCHRHFNETSVSITLGHQRLFETVHLCHACRESLVEVNAGDPNEFVGDSFADDWACQRCAHRGLQITGHFLWD